MSKVAEHPLVVFEGPPGSGKTTRVPPALLSQVSGEVWVLEPRRLAVRLAARRVADERGEKIGETVGYQVRFEEVAGPRTRLRFLTEGILNRKLLADARLQRVSAVVLDEFHERHLEGDLALALLRNLQRTVRPDLRLVVMSATLGAESLAARLGGVPMLRCTGSLHEVVITHLPYSSEPLEQQVTNALERLAGLTGHTLVFLPGAAEIHRCMRASAPLLNRLGWMALPLHGDLSPAEQDAAVAPSKVRKVLFSTNVAESSVTVDGVTAVIDSGLARVSADSPWSGIPALKVARISRASAVQRAGRAGRQMAGHVIRLYPAEDFYRRAEFDAPEILRKELSPLLLDTWAMGLNGVSELPWLDPPPPAALEAAIHLLTRLKALDANGLTALGRQMSRYAVHPRLARMIGEGIARGIGRDACAVAALLSTGARLPSHKHSVTNSDLFVLLEGEWDYAARRLHQQLSASLPTKQRGQADDSALLAAVLTGFPDRIARRRTGTDEFVLASGGSAILADNSTVRDSALIVALELEERSEQRLPILRLASAIEPEWLLDLFPEELREEERLEWNRKDERVDSVSVLLYGKLIIQEDRNRQPDAEAAAKFLALRALEVGLERLVDLEDWLEFQARLRFASENGGSNMPAEQELRSALEECAYGIRSWKDFEANCKEGRLQSALLRQLAPSAAKAVDELAPAHVRLPSGRQARVRYPQDQAPYVASRLQDFFGLRETPRIANGRVPLLVHLLAPNQRPVQVTADLAGFWQRLYPQVRRELSRRYPRHAWPENPG